MRLKSIKLAGFKSFVDPTTVNFPSNMAAVVGPNGCGTVSYTHLTLPTIYSV